MTSIRFGSGSEVRFDDANKCIRIFSNAPLIPGMRGLLREVAVFYSEKEWENSAYNQEVEANDDAISAISYFWSDIRQTQTT